MADTPKTRGPKPERVKLSNDWKSSLSEALKKTKPKDGWPKSRTAQAQSLPPGQKSI